VASDGQFVSIIDGSLLRSISVPSDMFFSSWSGYAIVVDETDTAMRWKFGSGGFLAGIVIALVLWKWGIMKLGLFYGDR
jgi:hypothetical protein